MRIVKMSAEHQFLLQSVKTWFNHPDQVAHYTKECTEGPTAAEQYLLSTLQSRGAVLDVGCGSGRISIYLDDCGYRVTSIDVSEGLLAVARELSGGRTKNIRFLHTEGLPFPFGDEQFDIVVGFKILCYIPTRALRNDFMKEMCRVLKPGGTCVMTQQVVPDECISDAEDEYFKQSPAANFQILEQGDAFPMGSGYVRWFTERELLDEIGDTPFEIEMCKSDAEYQGAGFLRLFRLRKPAVAVL